MTILWPFLVVLAPALLSAVLGLSVTITPWVRNTLKPWLQAILTSEEKVDHLREQVVSLSSLGPAVGLLFGLTENSTGAYIFSGCLYLAGHWLAWKLVSRLERIRQGNALLQSKKALDEVVECLQEQADKRAAQARDNWVD
ncbi:MAG: hypothetical protein K2X78_10200 [Burkholderiaceae bacterium]|nr:hypothetical protein [Burkholderiaceae bacterium]